MLKIFKTLFSVISLCMLCKPLHADEVNSFWQGFHNSGYSSINLNVPRNDSTQLNLNELSWFLSWDNNTRFKFFSELEVENPATLNASQGLSGKGSTLDLERLYIDYNINEKSNVRIGRFLTPIGRWNQLHAAPLVWTASRPLVTLRMFPYGVNGAMMFGNVFVNQTAIEYQLFAEAIKDQYQHNYEPVFKDVKGGRVGFNNVLGFGGENAGLNTIGLNVMTYRKDIPGSPLYRLYGLDFLIELDRWEFSGEAYLRKTVKGEDGGSGAYIQSAYALGHEWYWITRFENYRATDESDAKRWVQGLTKRLNPNQLLKFELIGGSAEYQDVPRGFVTSFAVMF